MVLKILLLILIPLSTRVQSCEREQAFWDNKSYHQLSRIGVWIEKNVFPKGEFHGSKNEELTLLKNKPWLGIPVKFSGCMAQALSMTLCGIDVDQFYKSEKTKKDHEKFNQQQREAVDEQTDALRHFFISSFLGCGVGYSQANEFLMSHEGPPPWSPSSLMDIHNNTVALDWIKQFPTECERALELKDLAFLGLQYLDQGKLQILKSGTNLCADPRKRAQELILDEGFEERVRTTRRQLSEIWPLQCSLL